MAKPKGPKWDEVHAPGSNRIEHRQGVLLRKSSRPGRSTVTLRCPFCEIPVTAYVWSLNGGGKRCDCGALAGRDGVFHHYAKGA